MHDMYAEIAWCCPLKEGNNGTVNGKVASFGKSRRTSSQKTKVWGARLPSDLYCS